MTAPTGFGHSVEIDGRDVSCSCGWTWHGDTVWTALYEHRVGLGLSHSDIDVHFKAGVR